MTLTVLEPAGHAVDGVDGVPLAQVQVWFGEHLIANWTGPAGEAPGIAAAWDRRYGIRPTVSPGVEW